MVHLNLYLTRGALLVSLWGCVRGAQAQSGCPGVQNLKVADVTATTATATFQFPFGVRVCSLTMEYRIVNGPITIISSPTSPVRLTGLVPNKAYILYMILRCFTASGAACDNNLDHIGVDPFIEFSTPSALATQGATEDSNLTLAPNPVVAGRTTLTLPTPLPHAQPVYVHDALGRMMQQLVVPAATKSIELTLPELPAGVYVVRCGTTVQRLVVE